VGGVLLYDPASDAFTSVDAAPNGPQYRPARLLDGRVLIEAPLGQTNYLFDPDTSQFTPAGPGPFSAGFPSCSLCDEIAYTLPDGRVWSSPGVVSDAMAVFDPAKPSAGFVKTTYTLPKPTTYAGTSMMGDGTVYFLGGSAAPQASCLSPGWSWLSDVVRVDPVAGTVTSFDALPEASGALAAASLQDGSIIAVGGIECGGISPVASLYFLKGQAPVIK
jgi:hypothetical protein